MAWLKDHGVTGTIDEYHALPFAVLQDCRLVMEAERLQREMSEGGPARPTQNLLAAEIERERNG